MSLPLRPAVMATLLTSFLLVPLTAGPTQNVSKKKQSPEETLLYQKEYNLHIYPLWYKLPEKKSYLGSIYKTLLADLLQIQKKVYIKDPTPVEIHYPRSVNSPESRAEYPQTQNKPHYFDLAISKGELPGKISPETWNTEQNLPLDKESFHLFTSLETLPSSTQQGNYRLSLTLFFGQTRLLQTRITGPEDNLPALCAELANRVRKILSGPSISSLSIDSELESSSIYLSGVFLGKTPAEIPFLIPGEYDLILRKEGVPDWKKKITIPAERPLFLTANNRAQMKKLTGVLRVTSDPPGADVYLDVTYMGTTPLVIENVLPGRYRLKLSHEGRIDQYRTIVIDPLPEKKRAALEKKNREKNTQKEAKKPSSLYNPYDETLPSLYVSLPPGNNAEHYQINPPVFLGLTNEELFQGSALTTGGLFLGGLFCLIQYENLNQQALALRSLSSPTTMTEAQAASYASEAATYKQVSDGLFIGAGVGFALSVVLFVQFIDSQDLDVASSPLKGKNYAFMPVNGPSYTGITVSHFW